MLSPTSRLLTRLLAVLYTALGIVLFFAPFWASQNFAWKVSPWVAMTIGGWCLGNAYFAWRSVRVWRWNAIFPNMVYLWSFGVLQTLVLIVFRDKLLLIGPVSWLYISTLFVNLICVGLGIYEWYKTKPKIKPEGKAIVPWIRINLFFNISFAVLVTVVMLVNPTPLIAGDIMPEKVSLFTIYAFGMFYLSLALAGLSLITSKGAAPIYNIAQGAVAFMIPTTLAAIFFFWHVNFMEELVAFLYITIYILIMLAAATIVKTYHN